MLSPQRASVCRRTVNPKGPSRKARHHTTEARKPAPGPDAEEVLAGDFPFWGLPHRSPELRLALGGQSVSPGWTSTLSHTVLRATESKTALAGLLRTLLRSQAALTETVLAPLHFSPQLSGQEEM